MEKLECRACLGLRLKGTQRKELPLTFPDGLISGVWEVRANPILAVEPSDSGHALASSQSPGFQQRKTTKQDTWPPSKPPLSFICDKPLFINPRTARRHWVREAMLLRGKTIRNTISVIKAGHKYLSSLSGEEGQDDSSQFLVLTKEETVHETGHLPGHFYLSDPRVGTREA